MDTNKLPVALKGDRVTITVDGEEYTGTVMNVRRTQQTFMYEILVKGGMVRKSPESEINQS